MENKVRDGGRWGKALCERERDSRFGNRRRRNEGNARASKEKISMRKK